MAITYRRLLAATLVAGLALLAAWTPARGAEPAPAPTATTPNIIFVLVDDLAWNLVPYMPQVRQLQAEGATFTNYTVTDSLCCPSRSSILTGQFPHDTGVFTNGGADGGFAVFKGRGNENRTFATALQGKGQYQLPCSVPPEALRLIARGSAWPSRVLDHPQGRS
ncbi:sulfatase-like hydrolase/transferase [Micromonospora arida]|uniref:sulfatase-like hydrolase/transferase n=1 Tax=Micromonospora arida TaxID=2203715 RepID=UPI0034082976